MASARLEITNSSTPMRAADRCCYCVIASWGARRRGRQNVSLRGPCLSRNNAIILRTSLKRADTDQHCYLFSEQLKTTCIHLPSCQFLVTGKFHGRYCSRLLRPPTAAFGRPENECLLRHQRDSGNHEPLLARIHPEVASLYYGYGLVCPPLLEG